MTDLFRTRSQSRVEHRANLLAVLDFRLRRALDALAGTGFTNEATVLAVP